MPSLPYVTCPGNIPKALEEIIKAQEPSSVNQDFVKTILKIPGGSGTQISSYLKKIGFADASGSPTEIYKKFRNPATSKAAMAKAIRQAYQALFVRNEYMYELDEQGLLGLVVEETGQAHDSNPVKLTVSCIMQLKKYADFYANIEMSSEKAVSSQSATPNYEQFSKDPKDLFETKQVALNLGYTINLHLPPTSDPAVFDAIFKSLKENFLRNEDA